MRVYVAGRTEDTERVRQVMAFVHGAGHEITFDWTGPDGDIRSDWRLEAARASQLAQIERYAVTSADLVILCGPEPHGGLGCFIEIGMALGRGIPVMVLEPVRESVFWYLSSVTRIPFDQLEEYLHVR